MSATGVAVCLICLSGAAFAADASFRLVKEDDMVSVYSKRPENCVSDGASVMFLVENHTRERLELKLELLNVKVKNKLTVLVEPSGNTSVLSLSSDPAACKVELVDMQVKPLTPKPEEKGPSMVPVGAVSGDPVL